MAITYAAEVENTLDSSVSPSQMADVRDQGGRIRCWTATIEYDGQASGDEIILAKIPAGSKFKYGILNASATAGGTATIAIGEATLNDGTPDPDSLRTAATFTTTDTPTLFGRVDTGLEGAAYTTDTYISALVGAAALPSNTHSLQVQLYFTNG